MAVNKETAILEITAEDHTQTAIASAAAGLSKLTKVQQQAKTESEKAARQMRAGLQQFGFQIQDIAVQAQMGTSPFVIFAQQGSQLASIFGAGGAAAGALVSIAGVIGMTLAPRIFDATSALEDMQKAGEGVDKLFKELDDNTLILSDSFLKMAEASSAAAMIELRRQRREISAAMDEAQADMAAGIGGMLERIEREARAAAIDPLTYATLVGIGQAPAIVGKGFEEIYGVTEANIARLRELGKQAAGGSIDDIQAFTAALSAIQEDPGTKAAFNEIAESISGLLVAVVNGEAQVAQLNAAMADLDGFISSTRTESDKSTESVQKMIDALQKQFQTYGMGSTAVALYEARLNGANLEEQEQIALLAGGIELLDLKAKSDIDAAKAAEDRIKAEERARDLIQKETVALSDPIEKINLEYEARRTALIDALELEGQINAEYNELVIDLEKARIDEIAKYEQEAADKQMQLMQARFQAAGQFAGALAGVLEEGTAAQRAALAIQKGLALAEAVMNMHRAIGGANAAPWPQNIPAIIQATSTGLSAIAGIKAASFEGGGFTGYGARVGGLDGKGGMPAIVHPNETVIDHTKGGAGTQVNITIQANDTRGFDELLMKRRGVIASIVQSSLNNVGRKI